MFNLHEKKPRYTHVIDRNDFRNWEDLIHSVAMGYEYDMVMLDDGDYYFLVRFSPFYQDITSVEDLMAFGAGDKDEADYPYKDWSMKTHNPYDMDFGNYVEWMLLLRHVQANVPPGLQFDGILAFDMCQ